MARLGDPLAPHSKPKHSPHPRTIAGGSSTVIINGSPAAVTGSAISCGGVAIGSGSVVIGDAHTPAAFSGVSPTAASARNSVAVAKTGSGHEKAVTPEKNGC
ncbi:PAAR domain-containing protein [Marinobacter sp. M3C]|uniref:PAAR domain-containing protein n=1 Tax=Marinobacter sp. M3C TaxID=2917715 RepID=UPI00200E33DD|nr:PAAR domain-containing protein [Marinobacter sp. M3C]UQG59523.1 PAAR domain-containing protein [Marinobacter sp. M3C]